MASAQLVLLTLFVCSAYGAGLEDKKGPLDHKVLNVPEATPVPYPIFQFTSEADGVSSYHVSGETEGKIGISTDGWLYLEEALEWSPEKRHTLSIEAHSTEGETVDGPYTVVLLVVDVNNNAPVFNQSLYSGTIREHSPAGIPFVHVFATDADDPDTPNSQLIYSIESQIPNPTGVAFFTINPNTGEISTTHEGAVSLRARTGVIYNRGETRGNVDVLKRKFDEFCSSRNEISFEDNPFFTCVQRAENRRLYAIQDPDYTLIVRVKDLGGGVPNALSSITRVNIAVTQNLWVKPEPFGIMENLIVEYPMLLTSVRANDPNALYKLVQKEKEIPFPFTINEDGEIYITGPLDRETKNMYILVVLAEDEQGVELEPPLEIQVVVEDVNDNAPECATAESVFEVQENEKVGSHVGDLLVHDADKEKTLNSLLTFKLLSQSPTNPSDGMFIIDQALGSIQVAKHNFRRKDVPQYHLKVSVTDGVYGTECDVIINVIDLNNEVPIFEKNDYGRYSVPELAEVGTTLLTITAMDADDPGTGSSKVEYHITAGDPDNVFAIEVDDATGQGRVYIARPLDYEAQSTYKLHIDARNPEPLIEGVDYDNRSSTVVVIELVDVDEPPVFTVDTVNVNIPENITVGATILTADAKDPEGHKIMFKLEGDEHGWLDLNAETGELKTKAELDREMVDQLTVRIIAYESEDQMQQAEREVSIQLMDVNDNYPKLRKSQGFICVKKPEPLMLTAVDGDAEPFGEPFTFTLQMARKYHNWEITSVNGTSAKLVLKKQPTSDQTFNIPVNIKDNAGVGVTHRFEVRVCNCTELGYCYVEPGTHAWKFGMSATVGILGGVLGFITLFLAIVICRIKKREKKKKETMVADGETNAML
ncbi:cadherin-17 [Ictalurus punctatus]|uniref:Cadherin-17 n=1 Tax=Ictalurus punctatus TaxID=7998 RepID=A0A2D0PTI7_ICTPU|nr:cadherin-17 [Ictalurus punctatus]XP_047006160.1 cadherin-17 [Ictalurus punctatus]